MWYYRYRKGGIKSLDKVFDMIRDRMKDIKIDPSIMVNDFDNVQNATVDLCIRVVNEVEDYVKLEQEYVPNNASKH